MSIFGQADPFLQFFTDNARMQHCMESIFKLILGSVRLILLFESSRS